VVSVTARAVEGAATEAVVRAVADALGVKPRQISVTSGRTSRDKLLSVAEAPADLPERVRVLLSR
jgi:uncharacterized protein YggU (UPF0235/DUF167 family)